MSHRHKLEQAAISRSKQFFADRPEYKWFADVPRRIRPEHYTACEHASHPYFFGERRWGFETEEDRDLFIARADEELGITIHPVS